MSDGNAGVGRDADSRRHTGYDLEGDSIKNEVLSLFGSATEDQRIPPLEPYHPSAGPGMFEQEGIDLILVERAMTTGFPGTDTDRMRRSQV